MSATNRTELFQFREVRARMHSFEFVTRGKPRLHSNRRIGEQPKARQTTIHRQKSLCSFGVRGARIVGEKSFVGRNQEHNVTVLRFCVVRLRCNVVIAPLNPFSRRVQASLALFIVAMIGTVSTLGARPTHAATSAPRTLAYVAQTPVVFLGAASFNVAVTIANYQSSDRFVFEVFKPVTSTVEMNDIAGGAELSAVVDSQQSPLATLPNLRADGSVNVPVALQPLDGFRRSTTLKVTTAFIRSVTLSAVMMS